MSLASSPRPFPTLRRLATPPVQPGEEGWVEEETPETIGAQRAGRIYSARKDQMPFPDWVQVRIDSVNLTVCGAGLDGVSCSHARSRMKKLRDDWSNSDDPQQREAATKFSERLEAADLAQKLVQRGSLHSLDKTVFQDRVKTLVSTNMVFPSALAREITDRHASDMMQSLLKGTLGTRSVCASFFPYDLDDQHGGDPLEQDSLPIDERGPREWDPFNPRGCDIPLLPAQAAEYFERCLCSYVLSPLLKQWSAMTSVGFTVIVVEIMRFLLQQPA
eukprot:7447454-Pyramimonas_sp.AAC.1